MIQWRNLNFDPLRYWKSMAAAVSLGTPMGMDVLIREIRRGFPKLKFGYFNPPKVKLGVEPLHRPLRARRNGHAEVGSF